MTRTECLQHLKEIVYRSLKPQVLSIYQREAMFIAIGIVTVTDNWLIGDAPPATLTPGLSAEEIVAANERMEAAEHSLHRLIEHEEDRDA